jgi:hypothetical protein
MTVDLSKMSRQELDAYRRQIAPKLFKLIEDAMLNFTDDVSYNQEKMDLILDALEMDVPPLIAGSEDLSDTDKDGYNSMISGMSRARIMGEFSERHIKQMLALALVLKQVQEQALDFLDVKIVKRE